MCLRRLEKLMLPYTSIAGTHKSTGGLPLSQNINIKLKTKRTQIFTLIKPYFLSSFNRTTIHQTDKDGKKDKAKNKITEKCTQKMEKGYQFLPEN